MTKKEEKKKNISAWQRGDTSPVELIPGLVIDSDVYEIKENRYKTLLLKGLIIYCLTAGGMGGYLSAIHTDFNQIFFNIIIFITALICAVLYHSWKSENLGYLVFFSVYASFLFMFKDYINSGFYAVINDTIDYASLYFDTRGMQYYNERISNRYVAITIAVTLIGIAINILLNNYILRRARYMIAIFLTVTINLIAFYMQLEPDIIYSLMMIFGIVMTFFLKAGGHYHLSRNDSVFEKTKKGLAVKLDHKSLRQGLIVTFAFVLSMVAAVNVIWPKESYDALQKPSQFKQESRETVSNYLLLGFYGLFNRYNSNGGLSTGQLGGVSSIRLDYKPDLELEFAPYTDSRIYIKNFTGLYYQPYDNVWNQKNTFTHNTYHNQVEALALKKAYEAGGEKSAKAIMKITNVGGTGLPYLPYATEGLLADGSKVGDEAEVKDIRILPVNQTETVVFYPQTGESELKVSRGEEDGASPEDCLQVPKDNAEVIAKFAKTVGVKKGDDPDVIFTKLRDYYQANVPYTVRPGATPWRADFINNFLTKNKKGYCAHFASAATLLFRYCGVPARYCEGYAVDFTEITTNGEVVEGARYEDYYDGYSAIGKTAVVKVSATDADAHAWVEIYIDGRGWQVREVTPSGGLRPDEDDDQSFWESFSDFFGDGGGAGSDTVGEAGQRTGFSMSDKFMKQAVFVVLMALSFAAAIFLFLKMRPGIRYRVAYTKANQKDKLALWYGHTMGKMQKKDKLLKSKVNYKEQLEYLNFLETGNLVLLKEEEKNFGKEKMSYLTSEGKTVLEILERAGFSNHDISREESERAMNYLTSVKKSWKKLRKTANKQENLG